MGKILVIFLCIFSVVVFGSSGENPESISTREISNELLTKMRELEKFHEEFKSFKSSLVELSAAFGRFHQSLTKNGAAESGQTGQAEGVSSTTPSPRQQSSTPAPAENEDLKPIASKSISSCSDAMEVLPSPRSKKQRIYPHGNRTSLEVLCDFETDGGGWTIIQKRSSGPQREFNRDWDDYKNGFGLRAGNFWLGLDNIRALTKNGDQELRIELEDFEGEKGWAKYSSFSVSDASDFYRLTLAGFSGDSTLIDSLTGHNGEKFSTIDNDNDPWDGGNCALEYGGGGGWWFKSCGGSNLNGLYFQKGETVPIQQGIFWGLWKGFSDSIAKTEMKIRNKNP